MLLKENYYHFDNSPRFQVDYVIRGDPLINIQQRCFGNNNSWMACICGATGSGKSYLAMMLAWMSDPFFNEENIVFETEDFIRLLNSPKIKEGSAIVYDELGKGAMAREFFKTENKELGKVLQTFRRMNTKVFFTVPSFDFADKMPRKLIHTYIQTGRITYSQKLQEFKFYNLEVNPRLSSVYNKFPIASNVKARTVKVLKPLANLIERYEVKKKIYEEGVRETSVSTIVDKNIEKKQKKSVATEVFDILKNRIVKFEDIPKSSDISAEFDINRESAVIVMKKLRLKFLIVK